MTKTYVENQTFEKIDFKKNPIYQADYENCTFIRCDLSYTDLSNMHFSECEFNGCNISMAKMFSTELIDARFIDCKLLWLNFENCSKLLCSFYFENSILDLVSFRWLKIKKTQFINSSLHEANFTNSDLTSSVFDTCDLAWAVFEKTILEKVDFRTSYSYSIDPTKNRIKKAKFSMQEVRGLLDQYDIEIV